MDSFRDFYNMDEEMCSTAVRYYRERYSVDGLYETKLYEDVLFVLKELKAVSYTHLCKAVFYGTCTAV